jgi:hypothetical protein
MNDDDEVIQSNTWFDDVSMCSFALHDGVYTARYELNDGTELVWKGDEAYASQRFGERYINSALFDSDSLFRVVIPSNVHKKISELDRSDFNEILNDEDGTSQHHLRVDTGEISDSYNPR